MCGKCYKLCPKCTGSFICRKSAILLDRWSTHLLPPVSGKEGFILENNNGLRWGPNELGFDDNRLSAGEYNGQNYCMLAKYGNKGTFTSKDYPSSRRCARLCLRLISLPSTSVAVIGSSLLARGSAPGSYLQNKRPSVSYPSSLHGILRVPKANIVLIILLTQLPQDRIGCRLAEALLWQLSQRLQDRVQVLH